MIKYTVTGIILILFVILIMVPSSATITFDEMKLDYEYQIQ